MSMLRWLNILPVACSLIFTPFYVSSAPVLTVLLYLLLFSLLLQARVFSMPWHHDLCCQIARRGDVALLRELKDEFNATWEEKFVLRQGKNTDTHTPLV
jgi:hypothetical protein